MRRGPSGENEREPRGGGASGSGRPTPDGIMSKRRRVGLLFACSMAALLIFGLFGAKTDVTMSGNEATRFATIRAVAEQNTFAMDGEVFRSVDRVVRDGRVYSDKPPVLPALLGVFCKLPVKLFGWNFADQYGLMIYLVNFIFFTGVNLAIFHLFFRRVLLLRGPLYSKWLLAFSLCSGSWLLSYSVTLNNHTPAALLLLAWFLLLEKVCLRRNAWYAFAAGAAAGLCLTTEIPVGAIIGAAGFPAVWRSAGERSGWRLPAVYCLGFLGSASLFPIVNYLAYGTIMPLYLSETGTYRIGSSVHFQFEYWWEALFGRRGVFSYQPLLLGALPALLRWGGLNRQDKALAGGCAAVTVFYLIFTNEYGGWAYGFRYLVAILPGLWFLAARHWLRRRGAAARAAMTLLAAAGVLTAVVGSYNPFCSIYEGRQSPPTTIDYRVRNAFTANLLACSYEHKPDGALSRLLLDFYGERTALLYLHEAYFNMKNIGMVAAVYEKLNSRR